MEQEKKPLDVKALIEKGKAKGSLSNADIMEAIEFADYDIDQIEKIYDQLEANGIEVISYENPAEFEEIETEVEQLESAEDMEKMLQQEGLAIDDPVRMYLKEIGKVPLLDAEKEHGKRRRRGKADAYRGKPETCRQHRKALCGQGHVLPRPYPGGQPGSNESR